MNLAEYQSQATYFRTYDRGQLGNLMYAVLGLNGEAGEVAEKVKKLLRDNDEQITPEVREALRKELGDVLWYLSACATDLGLSLDDVADANLSKLYSRKERGVLSGSGDNR
jgi:NTP pyrophosphatase (non-canonical NTP hydrolase)